MSNLVTHAKRELAIAGVEEELTEGIVKMIEIFASQGHSGSSAAYVNAIVDRLMQFKNISPLTDDPDEWMHVAEETWGEPGGIWQSTRRADAFSNDGGKTYYCLDDVLPERPWRKGKRRRVMMDTEKVI